MRGTSSSTQLYNLYTSDLSGLLPDLIHVLGFGIGSDLLEHGGIFEDIWDDHESHLTASEVDLL